MTIYLRRNFFKKGGINPAPESSENTLKDMVSKPGEQPV
jgi:hypothetical protein